MKTLELRTSLFRFDPTQLGRAYRVVIGEHYLDAWQALKGLAKKPHPGLPIIALEEMLTVLSGGPVKVNLSPQMRIPRHLDTQPTIIWTLVPCSLGHLIHVHLDRQSERSDAGLHC